MTEQQYDAELHDARMIYGSTYTGQIYADKRMRFKDGQVITTTEIISQEGDIVTTKNTKYKLFKSIRGFYGDYRWLSNFWLVDIEYEGRLYPSAEHAFVAAKTTNEYVREQISKIETPGQAKRFGRLIDLRSGWDDIKVQVMKDINREKYKVGDLRDALVETGNRRLYEENTWGDTFWGVCKGRGSNILGEILMSERSNIMNSYYND